MNLSEHLLLGLREIMLLETGLQSYLREQEQQVDNPQCKARLRKTQCDLTPQCGRLRRCLHALGDNTYEAQSSSALLQACRHQENQLQYGTALDRDIQCVLTITAITGMKIHSYQSLLTLAQVAGRHEIQFLLQQNLISAEHEVVLFHPLLLSLVTSAGHLPLAA